MAATTQTQGKKRGFKLDLDDMERRLIEFRVSLDREKRRCQLASMTDKYEKLLRDKLGELREQQSSEGEAGAVGPNQDHQITLTTLDQEASNRLANFLKYTVEMCKRIDQQELIQEVLRGALQETRRKRFKTQQENPSAPMEPFCLFCASSLDNNRSPMSCNELGHHQHVVMTDLHQPLTAITNNVQNNTIPRVELVHMTPPPSAVPTPEVGEQAPLYTPGLASSPARSAATSGPSNRQAGSRQPNGQGGSSSNNNNGRSETINKTNASSVPQQAPTATTSSSAVATVPPRISAGAAVLAAGDIVMPTTDEDGDTSDADSEDSVRRVLGRRLPNLSGPSGNYDDDESGTDERRCSTPISQPAEGSVRNLVIDESAQPNASPIRKPVKKYSAVVTQQQQSKSIKPATTNGAKTIAPGASTSAAATAADARTAQQQPQGSVTRSVLETSAGNLSRVEASSQPTRLSQGGNVRIKHQQKRRGPNRRP